MYHGWVKVLLLTARPDVGANQRLAEAAAEMGFELDVVDATRVVGAMGRRGDLWLASRNLLQPLPDALLARVGNWRPESLLALVEVAVAAGVATPNPPCAIRLGRDHWRTVMVLEAAGVPVPETMAGADPEALASTALNLGLPVVVKLRRSRMGVGVMQCERLDHLESVLDSLWRLGDEVLVQRFVDSAGSSLRLLVVGGRVVAAARFRAAAGEWRSNGARGGLAEAHPATDDECRMAVSAARALGLGICGVDLLQDHGRTLVCEVNPTPGFLHVERATGVDVAAAILRHTADLARQL
jgi:RimK family alpha-L-glutamate ligase